MVFKVTLCVDFQLVEWEEREYCGVRGGHWEGMYQFQKWYMSLLEPLSIDQNQPSVRASCM